MENLIESVFSESQRILKATLEAHQETIKVSLSRCIKSLKEGGTIFWAGNGGSAADAQHMAAELVGRYKKNRKSLRSIALTVDTSALTAIGNDFGFDKVFSRQLEGLGEKGDILIAISTSGNSANILEVAKKANELGLHVIALTGETGGKLRDVCHTLINVPSLNTPRIQETHLIIEHTLCEGIDSAF